MTRTVTRASMRLDTALVERGLYATRSRAADAVKRGCVSVDGRPVRKAGQSVEGHARLDVADEAHAYVSRAALKLVAALDASGLDPAGRHCLDVGASTGGFTQVLLERGAAHVTALDVGHGQLARALRDDPRVANVEGLNARDLTADDLPVRPELVVCDVSFISLTLALPPALALAAPGAGAVLLVKPQFEAGPEALRKDGTVDAATGERIATGLRDWLAAQPGWTATHLLPSPIRGGEGNAEWLLCGRRC